VVSEFDSDDSRTCGTLRAENRTRLTAPETPIEWESAGNCSFVLLPIGHAHLSRHGLLLGRISPVHCHGLFHWRSGKLGFQFKQDRLNRDENFETHSLPKQEPVRYIPWIFIVAEAFDLEPWPEIELLFPVKFCSYFVGMTDEGAKTIGRFDVSVPEFVFASSSEFFSNLR
jgi:hypothetical protein